MQQTASVHVCVRNVTLTLYVRDACVARLCIAVRPVCACASGPTSSPSLRGGCMGVWRGVCFIH